MYPMNTHRDTETWHFMSPDAIMMMISYGLEPPNKNDNDKDNYDNIMHRL